MSGDTLRTELVALRRSLEDTLATIEQVRSGQPEAGPRALPQMVRDDRPAESIPLLEQEVSDLRREIAALEAELARAGRAQPSS